MAGAPEAPEAGVGVGIILLAAACVFLLALNKVYRFSVGALLESMANMVRSLPHVTVLAVKVPPWDKLADGIEELNNYVLLAIGTGIQQTEKGLHALIGAMAWLLQETADQVAGLAEDTAHAIDWMRRNVIPAVVKGLLLGPSLAITLLQHQIRQLLTHPVQIIHATTRVVAPGLKALEGKVNALEAKVAAIGAAAPAAVASLPAAIPFPRPTAIPGDIVHGLDGLYKRVRGIGRTLTPAGIVGLVSAAVLSTLGLSWLKCRNVDKAAKHACGMNADVLEGLLAGLVALFGTFSLVEFGRYLIPVVDEVGTEVTHFWRADVAGQSRDRTIGSPSLTAL